MANFPLLFSFPNAHPCFQEQGFFDSGHSDAEDATNVPDENETKEQRKEKYLQKRKFAELKKEEDKQQSKRKMLKFNENTDISVQSGELS